MATIENNNIQQSTANPRLDAASFYEASGAQVLTQGINAVKGQFADYGQRQAGLVETENKLSQARFLAESRQAWMLDLDDRKMKAEQTGNWRGFRDNYDKEYTDWANGVIDKEPEGIQREQTRLALIEIHTPFLSEASNFEAQKRAMKIKENHDATKISITEAILKAKNEVELAGTIASNKVVLNTLPAGDVRDKMALHQNKLVLKQMVNFATTPEQIKGLNNQYTELAKSSGDFAAYQEGLNFFGSAETTMIQKKTSDANNLMQALGKSAELGQLPPDASKQVARVSPYLQDAEFDLKNIEDINTASDMVWNRPVIEQRAVMAAKQAEIEGTMDAEKRTLLAGTMRRMEQARENRDKLLAEDAPGVMIGKNDFVREAYTKFASRKMPVGLPPEQQAEFLNQTRIEFENYCDALISNIRDIGYVADVGVLAKPELDALAAEIKAVPYTENGKKQLSDRLQLLGQTHGKYFPNVIRQLRDNNALGGGLSVAAREPDAIRRSEIVDAIVDTTDPKSLASKQTVPANYSFTTQAMDTLKIMGGQNMREEVEERADLYDRVFKSLRGKGFTESQAAKKAKDLAVGNLETYNNIIVDKNSGYTAKNVFLGATMRLENRSLDIELLENTDPGFRRNVVDNPTNYITFINNKEGDGVSAVWLNTNNEPVLNNVTKKPIEYKFNSIGNLYAGQKLRYTPEERDAIDPVTSFFSSILAE